MHRFFCILALAAPLAASAASFDDLWMKRVARPPGSGVASFFSDRQTASGKPLRPYDRQHFRCASPKEPLGRWLKVTSMRTGRSLVCEVVDFGPKPDLRRLVDLTPAGFDHLGISQVEGLTDIVAERLTSETDE